MTPPPEITPEGSSSIRDGTRKLNSRIAFYYPATGDSPAMCMRLTESALDRSGRCSWARTRVPEVCAY